MEHCNTCSRVIGDGGWGREGEEYHSTAFQFLHVVVLTIDINYC